MKLSDLKTKLDEAQHGTFVGAQLTEECADTLYAWMEKQGFDNPQKPDDLHTTIVLDKTKTFEYSPELFDPPIRVEPDQFEFALFGPDQNVLVLKFDCPEFTRLHRIARKKHNITWDYDEYKPHITLAYGADSIPKETPNFALEFRREYVQPFDPPAPLKENIVYDDRMPGDKRTLSAINPSLREWEGLFRKTAVGIIMRDGTLVIGEGPFRTHEDTVHDAGLSINDEAYRLQLLPEKIIVEVWDDLDEIDDEPSQDIIDNHARVGIEERKKIGAIIRQNQNLSRIYPSGAPIEVKMMTGARNTPDRRGTWGSTVVEAYEREETKRGFDSKFNAWINVKTKKIMTFSGQITHSIFMTEHAAEMGISFGSFDPNGEARDLGWRQAGTFYGQKGVQGFIRVADEREARVATKLLIQKMETYPSILSLEGYTNKIILGVDDIEGFIKRGSRGISETSTLDTVKTYTPSQIAKKHGVDVKDIIHQLTIGQRIEREHTTSASAAREIALDHLLELPDYYSRLDRMEKDAKQDLDEGVEPWNGKNSVWSGQGYHVVVDDPEDATYVTVWTDDNKRIGALSTRGSFPGVPDYLGISTVDVERAHRGQHLGFRMYQALLTYANPRWRGISTYLPDVVNKKQVPAIYRRLGAMPHKGNEDILVVDRSTAPLLEEQFVLEGLSSILYHSTNAKALVSILEKNRFRMTPDYGTSAEKDNRKKNKPYYFSTTRSRLGNYHYPVYKGATSSVILVLDGRALMQDGYSGGPVDYWGFGDKDEMEDRIFSDKPYIDNATKYIREVHIYQPEDEGPGPRAEATRKASIMAKRVKIPTYVYTNPKSFSLLDKRKADTDLTKLKPDPDPLPFPDRADGGPTKGEYRGRHRGMNYLAKWMELLMKPRGAKLSDRARDYRYMITTGGNYRIDAQRTLAADIHNERNGSNREYLDRIFAVMKKLRLNSVEDVINYIANKYTELNEEIEFFDPDMERPESVFLATPVYNVSGIRRFGIRPNDPQMTKTGAVFLFGSAKQAQRYYELESNHDEWALLQINAQNLPLERNPYPGALAGEYFTERLIPSKYIKLIKVLKPKKLDEVTPVYRYTDTMKTQAKGMKCQVIVEMPAMDFLRLTTGSEQTIRDIMAAAQPLTLYNRAAKAGHDPDYRDRINRGKTSDDDGYMHGTIQMPWLIIRFSDDGSEARVVGHEGRHRTAAFIKKGGERIRVALCMRPGKDMLPDVHFGAEYHITSEHIPERIQSQFSSAELFTSKWKIIDGDMQKNTRRN